MQSSRVTTVPVGAARNDRKASPSREDGKALSNLGVRVHEKARELGFDAVAIASATGPLEDDYRRYEAFLEAGMHGTMGYLAENREARRQVDAETILAGAKSVVCLARRYQRDREGERQDPALARMVARYARGRDYHNFLRRKVRKLAAFLRTLGPKEGPGHVEARPLCDDAPILERAWAARAGLGFIGKNGMLIVPGQGSMVLLAEVVTTLELPVDEPMTERCGSCTRCLEACPTQAFPAPWVLDARRCIAYLTIEHRGAIDENLRPSMGGHLFGCDDCQTVCPYNASERTRGGEGTAPFQPLERWADMELAALLDLNEAQFFELTEGSPLRRATREGLARNAVFVLARRGDREVRRLLHRAACHHDLDSVREAAQWVLRAGGQECSPEDEATE